jgi:hypothetical protein
VRGSRKRRGSERIPALHLTEPQAHLRYTARMNDSGTSGSGPASPGELTSIGIGLALVGAYFMLVGLGVLPVPGGEGNLHAPHWIAFCCGAVFGLAGLAVMLQAAGRANAHAELPADAPRWMHAAQYLLCVALFALFALIGSWVAISGDARYFSGSAGGVSGPVNAGFARTMFGLGAIVMWLASIGYAIQGARKLLRKT